MWHLMPFILMYRLLIILTIGIVFSSRGDAQDTIAVSTEWNLIGAMSTIPLSQLRSEPPGIVISSYFGYTPSGYIATDTLRKGKGYWVRVSQDGFLLFPSFQNNAVRFVIPDTIEVNQDWNLIGAISTKALTGLRSEPPGIIISNYFGYTSIGYALEDTLQKGRGYWVKASQAGIITQAPYGLPPGLPNFSYPENGEENVPSAPIIRWTCIDPENDPLLYDVYLDTINPPTTKIASNLNYAYYLSSGLMYTKTYFWKIVASDNHGNTTSSDVWSFTVRETPTGLPPNMPSFYYPENGEEDVPPAPIIQWSCMDPENDPILYDIYLDTINPPLVPIASGLNYTYYLSSGLKYSKTYFWKIVASDNHGNTTSSDVWSFTIREAPIPPCGGITSVRYSGKTYTTVEIGSQCWFKQNLNVGLMVDSLRDQTDNDTIEKYCYRNQISNCNTYGGLYQWHEAMQYSTEGDSQGICPQGWHIPSSNDIDSLRGTAGINSNAYKAIGQGTGGGAGTNTTGFSALLSGLRSSFRKFLALGSNFYLWTATGEGQGRNYFYLDSTSDYVYLLTYDVQGGFSIRCLKN